MVLFFVFCIPVTSILFKNFHQNIRKANYIVKNSGLRPEFSYF